MPATKFEVLDASGWEVDADEPAGQDEKYWLLHPVTGEKWLFKPAVEKNSFRQREDFSEKISAHLAAMMRIPAAEVELAVWNGRPGSLSKNLRPHGWEMQPGLLLLAENNPQYQGGPENIKGRPGHSLEAIRAALQEVGQPLGSTLPPEFSAFDVFAGYMLLDAWIANRDRHDENWSVLLPGPPHDLGESRRLCGTYDQAGGLGYNVKEAACQRMLAEQAGGVQRWVEKGTAYRFEYDPVQGADTLVVHACRALEMTPPAVRDYWIANVTQITLTDVAELVSRVPNMSEPCRTFAIEILRINKERVLDACS